MCFVDFKFFNNVPVVFFNLCSSNLSASVFCHWPFFSGYVYYSLTFCDARRVSALLILLCATVIEGEDGLIE
jgi:hypothetical protein